MANFEIHETFYAICGMVPRPLATDLTVSTSDYQAFKLGTDKQKATKVPLVMDKGGVLFDRNNLGEFDKNGSFGIASSSYDQTQYGE